MLTGLITAILQLLSAKFAVPFALQAAAAAGVMLKIRDYGISEALFYAGAIGLMIFLIGLVVALVTGGRVPLIGGFLLSILFALAPAAVEQYIPGLHAQLMGYLGQLANLIKMPLDKYVLVAVASFIGYWLSVAMRGPAREY